MQNKGLVRFLAVCLAVVCAFYLSFSFVTSHYSNAAKEYAQGDSKKEYRYLDSIATQKVWLGYTLKECREKEINLGLDLKGGMNVTMEVSVPDILVALCNDRTNETFVQAMALAKENQKNSGEDFVTLFAEAFQTIDPNAQLATVFNSMGLKEKINLQTSNAEVVTVLREEVEAAITNSFNVLRTRIDRFGVVQPNIQRLEQQGRILIELPGVKEPERVRKLLQGTANLEFWETYDQNEVMNYFIQLDQTFAQLNAATEEATAAEATEEKVEEVVAENTVDQILAADSTLAQETKTTEELRAEALKHNPLLVLLNYDGNNYRGPVIGTVLHSDTAAVNAMLNSQQAKSILPRDLKLCWTVKAIDPAETLFQLVALKDVNRGKASLGGDVITDARADFGQTSAYANVSMTMNAEGAKAWARITKDNIGKSIAIVLDGYVYSFPTVQNEITGGSSQITGNFTVEEAKDLANTLKSGKMPAPARIIEESVVGPSLGQEAINNGLWSFVIAFCLVLLYMIFYYGLIPGLIADAALVCNVFLLFGVLASFGSVLTLPGIAGIVLTMGMAVDANVLIYERIREEMKAGKNLKKAISEGYANAISAIIDANVTTFLTGAILATLGTGPIKGFAVTLMIGIVTSFLTAVFISRLLLERYADSKNAKDLPFTTNITKNWFQNTNFDFIKARFVGYIVSGTLIVLGILGLMPGVMQSELNWGIDFSGGRNYVIRFQEPVQPEEIRELLEDEFDGIAATVITIGDANQVRVSTKYGVDSESETIDDEIEARLYKGLQEKLGADVTLEDFTQNYILSSQKVGPSIADDIKVGALWATIIALLVMGLYILLRFRNVAFSLGAIAGLTHDALILIGAYAILWKWMPFSMEIDQSFVAAILTVIGYSINDTVVVFDRIREYNTLYPKHDNRLTINGALNATLSRTFSTSMSTLVVVIAIFIFGGETIRGFIFALMIGIIIATYSTWFVAVPLSYDFKNWGKAIKAKREAKKALK